VHISTSLFEEVIFLFYRFVSNDIVDKRKFMPLTAEKRAGRTPQRGTSEEACMFVRRKGVTSLNIDIPI
jgi:hypothetical protein